MLNGPALFKLGHHHNQAYQDVGAPHHSVLEQSKQLLLVPPQSASMTALESRDPGTDGSSSGGADTPPPPVSAVAQQPRHSICVHHHPTASPFLAAAAAAAASAVGTSGSAAAAAAVAAAAAAGTAPTSFVLGTQQFLLTPPPPGVQLMTIPVSLATLPGSNQIPVIATSTGQLILANVVNVPHSATSFMSSAAAAFAAQQLLAAAAASSTSQAPSGTTGDSPQSLAPAPLPPQSLPMEIASCGVNAQLLHKQQQQRQQQPTSPAPPPMDQDLAAAVNSATLAATASATAASAMDESGEDDSNKHTVNQITDADMVDGVDLEDIREFAKQFKLRRLSLGLTQTQVGAALSAAKGPAYSQSAICRFEKLDITPKSAAKIKPVLESWMAEAEEKFRLGGSGVCGDLGCGQLDQSCYGLSASDAAKKLRKRRTSFTPTALEILNEYFEQNSHPTGAQMTELARSLRYEREVIRVWFCNKRQALKNTVKRLQRPQDTVQQHGAPTGAHSDRRFSAAATAAAGVAPAAVAANGQALSRLHDQSHGFGTGTASAGACIANVVSPFTYRSTCASPPFDSSHDNCANDAMSADASPHADSSADTADH